MQRRQLLGSGAALVSTGLAGCLGGSGGDSDDGGTGDDGGDGGSSPDATVTISGSSYDPVELDIATGTTVEWTNQDSYGHDVTSAQFTDAAASWDFAEAIAGGESITHTFETEGVYEYYCTIHGESTMCGAVLVGGSSLEGSLPCQTEDGDGGMY